MIFAGVFVNVMLPLLVVTGLGAWIARSQKLPVGPLSGVVFLLFSPALTYDVLANLVIPPGLALRVVGVMAAVFVVSAIAAVALGRLLGRPRPAVSAFALSAALANLGNMGLPVSSLAFGEEGLAVGVVAMVTGSVLAVSGGVVIASLGAGGMRRAVSAPLRVPALWAMLPGVLVNQGVLVAPGWVEEVTGTLAGAAIPTMLVVLGLQTVAQLPKWSNVSALVVPVTLRLVGGPLIAAAVAMLAGLDGVARSTVIVLAGMPTAVVATIICAQYGGDQSLVSRSVVVSTIFSLATLTILIGFLAR